CSTSPLDTFRESVQRLLLVEPCDDGDSLRLAVAIEGVLEPALHEQDVVPLVSVPRQRASQTERRQPPVQRRRRIEAPGRPRHVVLAAAGRDERHLLEGLELDRGAVPQLHRARAELARRIAQLEPHRPNSSTNSFELTKLNRNLLSLFGRKSLSS